MRVGTKSLLFGVHQVFIHPWFVALAWWKLYGFPWDPRLWVAFIVHDWGYWGKPNMDSFEGEFHPELGAEIMFIFGMDWYWFTLLHSRFFAKKLEMKPSRLCMADKLSFKMTPWWLYIPLAILSGEIKEYRSGPNGRTKALAGQTTRQWRQEVVDYMDAWLAVHMDGEEDTWTKHHDITAL